VSSRPLEKLPTIRAKLGSTIVFAVGMTIVLIFVMLGYTLRNAPRDTRRLTLLTAARNAAAGFHQTPPSGVTIVRAQLDGTIVVPTDPEVSLPTSLSDGRVHVGSTTMVDYAVVPVVSDGVVSGIVSAVEPAQGAGLLDRFAATFGFLRDFWWQFLLAGLAAAAIALAMARWLARGMTQPLRDMAQAASKMETGDYSQRVHTRSRDEVGQLAAAFNRMSAELESLESLRRDLVANVSHELKTPISALRAHLENLLDGVEVPDPHTLEVMLAQSERLGRLVDQLLDLSRLESGDVPLEQEDVQLQPLVMQVLSEIEVARAESGVRVDSQIPEDLPAAFADRERIHQVLFNLVDNAIRFTPRGGEVTVSANRHNGSVEVKVQDTGVGIAAEHLPKLFERFYRVDSARSREDGGTGIGLAIARSVVEAHGGHISADSRIGHGSTFTFELPAAAGDGRRDP
jgi:signal transduction histidine kinase